MNIVVIYGTERKGCTYNIAQQLMGKIDQKKVTEYFLPKDMPNFCVSCFKCFMDQPDKCPNSTYTIPIRQSLVEADVIVLTSPVYAYHISGQMKTFLDHYANMWMVHRPEASMFSKKGVVIATATGPVYKKSLDEMKDSLDFWGVSKVYKIGAALMETEWGNLSPKIVRKIDQKTERVAHDLHRSSGRSFRVRKWFTLSRLMHKYMKANPVDADYWQAMGWLDKKRPW